MAEISTTITSNMELQFYITKVLHDYGVPSHIKGYKYLKNAVSMVYNDRELLFAITKELYPEIAKQNKTTSFNVERAIRHAIQLTWSNEKNKNFNSLLIGPIFFNESKPSNKEFIAIIADRLLDEPRIS